MNRRPARQGQTITAGDDLDIDAVITWVDGEDPAFRRKFDAYAAKEPVPSNRRKAVGANFALVRYHQNEELRFCLRSLLRFAPWLRKIWLVTDSQFPDFLSKERLAQSRIAIVSHQEIFAGFENVLPTFASTTIESMMWRIDGLAEHFLYLNDDFFLLRPLGKADFFDPRPILRGKRRDLSEPGAAWLWRRRNAATLLGLPPDDVFLEAHVVAPMRRSVMGELFDVYRSDFLANIGHRFRSRQAFHPITMHNHFLLTQGAATEARAARTAVLDGCAPETDETQALTALSRLGDNRFKMGCVNDLGSFLKVAPSALDLMESIFGPPLDIEAPLPRAFENQAVG